MMVKTMTTELEFVLFQFCETYILLTKVKFHSLNKIRESVHINHCCFGKGYAIYFKQINNRATVPRNSSYKKN